MSDNQSPYLSELKRVRGLGASHEGTGHFWLQRMSALALIPLTVWFLSQVVTVLLASQRPDVALWFKSPITALLMALFVGAAFIHARIGVQEIIEDYAHCKCLKLTLLLFNSAANYILALASIVAIAHLHFNGI